MEAQYLQLLREILENGTDVIGRNQVKARVLLHRSLTMSLETFPILTVKSVPFRWIVEEFLWFILGRTDNQYLLDRGVSIWTSQSSREYLDSVGLNDVPGGSIGLGYGHQFRNLQVDQIAEVLRLLILDPSSRRIIINLWNVEQLDKMALPPCHLLYQFNVLDGVLHTVLFQRSWDCTLGWNTSTAGLLAVTLAHMAGLKVGTLCHFSANVHVYHESFIGASTMLQRQPYPAPTLETSLPPFDRNRVTDREYLNEYLKNLNSSMYILKNYQSHPKIAIKMQV